MVTIDEMRRALQLADRRDMLRSRATVMRTTCHLRLRCDGIPDEIDALEGMNNGNSWDLRKAIASFYENEADGCDAQLREMGVAD